MKPFILTLTLLLSLPGLHSQSIDREKLTLAASHFICLQKPGAELRGTETLLSANNRPVGMIFRFSPAGFVITTMHSGIRPVYAYSFTGNFNLPAEEMKLIRLILQRDIESRMQVAGRQPIPTQRMIGEEWELFLSGRLMMNPFQQWPPEGSTTTGGWVETNWKQSAPYNNMCPMDLNAGARSIAGCPSIAMAQIVHYHQILNSTNFGDDDDYYHSYGSGNQYWIDNDHEARGFPSFDSLNTWLNSLEYAYQNQLAIGTEMKAALCFACGIAAHQVYSASMSGTFGIDQAWDSFQRFAYEDSRLIFPDDTTLNAVIAENIKVALPVQLGLLVEPPGGGGHNLVVDGYNTDEYYHFNFGWGGSANGWYTLPPTNIAYNLTIIEGAVVDIKSSNYTGSPDLATSGVSVVLFPNPVADRLTVQCASDAGMFQMYNLQGEQQTSVMLEDQETQLDLSGLIPGVYLVRISAAGKELFSGKLIKQ